MRLFIKKEHKIVREGKTRKRTQIVPIKKQSRKCYSIIYHYLHKFSNKQNVILPEKQAQYDPIPIYHHNARIPEKM